MQFYTKNTAWKNCFNKGRKLKGGDFMIISFKNGELKYCVNDIDLGVRINIDLSTNKISDPYLFVHVRNEHSKAEYLSNF